MRLLLTISFLISYCFAQNIVVDRKATSIQVTATGAPITVINPGTNNVFSFTLPDSANTSAGVYKLDGADTVLVRTLWSNERYGPGAHSEQWDGLLDNRTQAPAGSYQVKVLSSNVTYSWEGARIGNTSAALTGSTAHRGYEFAKTLCVSGGRLFYGMGYQEKSNTQIYLNTNSIQERYLVVPNNGGVNQLTSAICTDGEYVYWGGNTTGFFKGDEPGAAVNRKNFVFATRVSDNSQVTFDSGINLCGSTMCYNAIGVTTHGGTLQDFNQLRSLAVQKTGNFLFEVVPVTNTLTILHKKTGATLRVITISGIRQIAVDTSGLLWVATNSSILKYTVNSNATLTATGQSVTGITQAEAMAVSPDNNTLVVADGAVSQQVVKAFDSKAGGSAQWILGTLGGYSISSAITNYKFYFNNFFCSLTYQPDGSLWVLDAGNSRIIRYNASRQFVDKIEYMASMYEVHVDPNSKSRLFVSNNSGFMEYQLDYTKTLDNGADSSWVAKNNWRYGVPGEYRTQSGVSRVTSFGGRTYTIIQKEDNSALSVFELVPNGLLRKTKVADLTGSVNIDKGGRLIRTAGFSQGNPMITYVYNFTSLDGDNDPVWPSTASQVITSPVLQQYDAINSFQYSVQADKVICYEGNIVGGNENLSTPDYHLTAYNLSGKRLFNTSPGNSNNYTGDFPSKGEHENGNFASQGGAYLETYSNSILATYRGENWKQIQVNYFNHFHTTGLFVGQFGRDKISNGLESFPAGAEGNMFSGSWVQDTPDRAYLFSGGEGIFGGVHRWRIDGLTSVQIQNCALTVSSSFRAAPNLMAGFNHQQKVVSSNGWSLSHASDENYPGTYQTGWYVSSGFVTASKFDNQDISAYYHNQSVPKTVSRDLGNNNATSWKLSAIAYWSARPQTNNQIGQYFEVLDNAGKIIVSIREEANTTSGVDYSADMVGNNVPIIYLGSESNKNSVYYTKSQPISIENSFGTLILKYADGTATTAQVYETGANKNKPTTFRMRYTQTGNPLGMSVNNLKLTLNNVAP